MSLYSKLSVFLIILFCLLQVNIPWVYCASDNTLVVSLSDAEEAVKSAYDAVFEAKQAGAIVDDLVEELNIAGKYLSAAYVWYHSGDSENASRFAGLCYDTVKDLRSEAIELRDEEIQLGNAEFVITVFGSVVSMIVVVVSGFIVWRLFKQRYFKQVLGLRPEVDSNES